MQTTLAAWSMAVVLPYHGTQLLELAILGLFVPLFAWVSAGFWTALTGFLVLLSGRDRYRISRTAAAGAAIGEGARTAIVMPIANESVSRVFAGLQATFRSLAATGELRHFDFFVLSDTGDPDLRVAEVVAWHDACCALDAVGRLFYRRRTHRLKRKSGNLADFCRRWGRNYRYMVVLDADSVMSGECLTTARADDGSQPRLPASSRRCRSRRGARRCSRACSSSPTASTVRSSPRGCTSGSSGNPTTGDTTRSFASRPSCAIARSAGCRAAARCPARSSRTTSSRRR